jgi:hypothetical protein
MPNVCVIDFGESRFLDPIERATERNRNLQETAATDTFPCGIYTISVRDIGRKADYGARRTSHDHSIEGH